MDEQGRPIYDFIGRYEKVDSDWQRICDQLKLKGAQRKLGKHNISTRNSTVEYYTSRNVEIIREAYREDFLTFGYSTNLE
jgi:hypothetical protein